MKAFNTLSKNELLNARTRLREDLAAIRESKLSLDMTRGKPSSSQLDLSMGLLNIIDSGRITAQNGTDCRNYGGLDGLEEAKHFFSDYMGVSTSEVIIGGNSSLNMMHDAMSISMLHGTTRGGPWVREKELNFLCPVPGYDRHFAVCEHLGIKMIPVSMDEHGPDMERVEALVRDDSTIKGIWCVPKYSNPTGACYSDDVVDRLATMPTAAEDFRIFWDNAYSVHHLGNGIASVKDILGACKHAGNEDRAYMFGSTSKITFPGSGIAVIAGSEENMAFFRQHLSYQTIGPDKLNQLRHVRFLENMDNLVVHMDKHAILLKARFDAVLSVLESNLSDKEIANWSKPDGGYFIDLDVMPGTARKIVAMASSLGVKLTPAGATYPYGNDPRDRNIRIAPSFPSVEDVNRATEVLCACIVSVSIDKLLGD